MSYTRISTHPQALALRRSLSRPLPAPASNPLRDRLCTPRHILGALLRALRIPRQHRQAPAIAARRSTPPARPV
jgi:hypothetical protein